MPIGEEEAYEALLRDVEPRLRRSLVAASGREAAADALAWDTELLGSLWPS